MTEKEYRFNPTMQKGSIILALIGTVFTLVGVCVDQWLVYDPIKSGKEFGPEATVGLWQYTGLTNNGDSFELNWQSDLTEAGPDVEPLVRWWFSEPWVDACRAMVMFGLIMAGLGLAYQIIFPLRSHSYVNAKIVMIFHFIAGISIISCGAIWCSSITSVATKKSDDDSTIVEYLYTGSYGFAVWMVWVGGGFFLPAAGLAFEGGFINEKGFNYQELMN